jgi:hypothetical protein
MSSKATPDVSFRVDQVLRRPTGGCHTLHIARTLTLVTIVLMAPYAAASANEVSIPLSVPLVTLREAIKRAIYTGTGSRADLWTGTNDCEYLRATNPRFASAPPALVFQTDADLSVGMAVAGKCLTPVAWEGIAEAQVAPYVAPDWLLKFHAIDLQVFNDAHEKTPIAGQGFDLVKQYFIPSLEQFSFSLKPPIANLTRLIQLSAPPEVAQRVKDALSTLSGSGLVEVKADSVRVILRIDVPEVETPPAPASTAPLTPAEVQAWSDALDNWDAFVVFAVKQLGLKSDDKGIHDQLFTLLIDSRYKLVQALAHPQSGSGADPVRLLFLEVWGRLGAIVRDAAARNLLGDQTLEFLSFISAGDALVAFDQAAPALGMRISEADLRQLARIMAPSVTTNPLKFEFEEDPVLRGMFGLREPLTSPGPLETTEGEFAGPAETPAASAAPTPTASPSPPATPGAGPTALRDIWRAIAGLRYWLRPDAAYAGDARAADIVAISKRLKRKLPDRNNLESYRDDVGRLLELSAERQLNEDELERKYSGLYLTLVRTTAWQESCWRQWVREHNRITWLESPTGDIGLMQINKYIWRGLLNVARLKYDEVYNAGAGCQILGDLMQRYVLLGKLGGGANPELARSTYSAYNAGPSFYDRWRHKNVPADQHEIDLAFWSKYQALERGERVAILECVEQREANASN